MKNIFFFIFSLFVFTAVVAQEKSDSVYMQDGKVNIGKVTAINDDGISFTYKGETLGYSFKKTDITKIVFASGRVQNFGDPAPANNTTTNIPVNKSNTEHHNKIAVLPFRFLDFNQQNNTEWGYKVQQETYTYLTGKATGFNIQDPSTTNVLLGKAGISFDNIRSFTQEQICNTLGVEFVVSGTVTTNAVSLTSTNNTTYNQKSQDGTDKKGSTDTKSTGNVSSTTSAQQNYKTSVLMEIYKDDGDKIFGQDREAFWSTIDAYKSTLQYLLKKTPFLK